MMRNFDVLIKVILAQESVIGLYFNMEAHCLTSVQDPNECIRYKRATLVIPTNKWMSARPMWGRLLLASSDWFYLDWDLLLIIKVDTSNDVKRIHCPLLKPSSKVRNSKIIFTVSNCFLTIKIPQYL